MPVAALAPLGIIIGALTVTGIGLHYNHLLWAGGEVRAPRPPRAPPTTATHGAAVARGRMLSALRAAAAAAAVALHARRGELTRPSRAFAEEEAAGRLLDGASLRPRPPHQESAARAAAAQVVAAAAEFLRCQWRARRSLPRGCPSRPVAAAALGARLRYLPGSPSAPAASVGTGESDATRVARAAPAARGYTAPPRCYRTRVPVSLYPTHCTLASENSIAPRPARRRYTVQ